MWLSENPNAIHILEKHLDKVEWWFLSRNENAIHILEKNIDKINWPCLSCNKNVISILEKNLDKVDLSFLLGIPNAIHLSFSLNYEKMKHHMKGFCEELVQTVFHPKRLQSICDVYGLDMVEYLELV